MKGYIYWRDRALASSHPALPDGGWVGLSPLSTVGVEEPRALSSPSASRRSLVDQSQYVAVRCWMLAHGLSSATDYFQSSCRSLRRPWSHLRRLKTYEIERE